MKYMNEKFTNAYGESMSSDEMIQQLMHRVAELEKQSQWHDTHISNLTTELKEHHHDDTI